MGGGGCSRRTIQKIAEKLRCWVKEIAVRTSKFFRNMTEMRGFMERVAQVVARQEHDWDNGLPRVLGVVEGRLARQEATTQHLTEATGSLRTCLDEQYQRIVELVHELQNLRRQKIRFHKWSVIFHKF